MKTYYRVIIATTALIIGIGILLVVVIIPSLSGIFSLSKSIKEEHSRVERTVSHALKLREIMESIETIEKELPSLEQILVQKGREIEFFSWLEEKSHSHSLTNALRLSGETITPSQIKKLNLDIETDGAFLNILRLLADIEQSKTALSLQSLDFRIPTKSTASQIETTALFKGTAYVQQ